MRENKFVECLYKRVCSFPGWIFSKALYLINGACRYFPTVYEPTVFENYVHGKP
jgi:hypothetical protein